MQHDISNPHHPRPVTISTRWLRRSIAGTILLTCCLAFSLPYAEPDLWGHVQFGRDALRDGLPRTTTYSFTAVGHAWINHENLSEVSLAWIVDHLGVWPLLVGKCLLGLVIVTAIFLRARRDKVQWLPAAATVLAVASALAPYWQVRPQLATYGLFALLVWLLGAAFRGWEGSWQPPWGARIGRSSGDSIHWSRSQIHWLWWTPLVFAVWANAHGGFVAGYCIFAVYLTLRATESSLQTRSYRTASALLLFIVAGGLATLLTPYGVELHKWLLQSLTKPRPEITEWHPLGLDSESLLPFVVLAGATVAGLAASRKSLDLTQVLLLAITGWQAILHQRHVPFFAILAAYWMPVHWQSALDRFRTREDVTWGNRQARRLATGLVAANVLMLALLWPRLVCLRVDKSEYPVSAIEYMCRHDLRGRLVVTYNWAQYAIAAVGTSATDDDGIQVAFDGRFRTCYPQSIVDEHFDFILGTDGRVNRYLTTKQRRRDPARVLRTGEPDLVLISRLQTPSVRVMQQHASRWVLLYQDQLAQLWGRCDKYDDPQSPAYVAPSNRVLGNHVQTGYVAWPAIPEPRRSATQVAKTRPHSLLGSGYERGPSHGKQTRPPVRPNGTSI